MLCVSEINLKVLPTLKNTISAVCYSLVSWWFIYLATSPYLSEILFWIGSLDRKIHQEDTPPAGCSVPSSKDKSLVPCEWKPKWSRFEIKKSAIYLCRNLGWLVGLTMQHKKYLPSTPDMLRIVIHNEVIY